MRRSPEISLLTGATFVVIAALLVSELCLALPHLDSWCPAILGKIESATGPSVSVSRLSTSWQNLNPMFEVRSIRVQPKDGGEFLAKRVTLVLDVWQSLLRMRWQFRDLIFWQPQLRANTPIQRSEGRDGVRIGYLSDLFLRQFDHFDLRDSRISFITLSDQRAELAIPQPTWLNGKDRHRAEGQVSLSSLTG